MGPLSFTDLFKNRIVHVKFECTSERYNFQIIMIIVSNKTDYRNFLPNIYEIRFSNVYALIEVLIHKMRFISTIFPYLSHARCCAK